ncbi:MAG: hypothetical protein HND44_22300 [Chloroflexi bacterium]|nr:hypothetical protein [Ardenticatenaceae bacterium]MBL1131175.1 hypothetical protein [Chloroflexota bacterium]NOG37274.1 hypothetical protein [Chloroflexota bacterium]
MKLSEQDATLFFDLMFSLQFFVKQQLGLFPELNTLTAYREGDSKKRLEIRNAVWDNPHLIQEYARLNPDNLNQEHLDIIGGWQQFQRGNFVMERHLKQYTVFVGDENKVYGVLGLLDEIEDVIPRYALPLYVQAVLLPIKGVIVYDGLLLSYALSFGGGMRASFKEAYNAAKRKGEIIVSFDTAVQAQSAAKAKKPLKDWQPTIAALNEQAQILRAQAGSPPSWGPAFSLVKASLALAETAVTSPEDSQALWNQYNRVVQALNRLENGIYRIFD